MVGVLGAEASPAAQSLVAELAGDPHLRVRPYEDPEAMRLAAYRGRLHGGLVVPPGWTPGTNLPLLASQAGAGTPVLRALVDRAAALQATRAAPRAAIVVVDGEVLGSPPVGFQYTAPANLVLFVVMTAIFAAASIVSFRTTGLGQRLLAAPVSRRALVLGLNRVQIMVVQCVFLVAVGALAFRVNWGSPAGVVLVTAGLVVAGAGMTLFLGTLFRSPGQTTTVGPFLGILLGMLGGCMWPLEVVPEPVRALGHLFPTAWAMDGYLALSFGGAGASQVLPEAGALLAFGGVLLGLGTWRGRASSGIWYR